MPVAHFLAFFNFPVSFSRAFATPPPGKKSGVMDLFVATVNRPQREVQFWDYHFPFDIPNKQAKKLGFSLELIKKIGK